MQIADITLTGMLIGACSESGSWTTHALSVQGWSGARSAVAQRRGDSRAVLFILNVLDPMTDELTVAAERLISHVTRLVPQVRVAQRLITHAGRTTDAGRTGR